VWALTSRELIDERERLWFGSHFDSDRKRSKGRVESGEGAGKKWVSAVFAFGDTGSTAPRPGEVESRSERKDKGRSAWGWLIRLARRNSAPQCAGPVDLGQRPADLDGRVHVTFLRLVFHDALRLRTRYTRRILMSTRQTSFFDQQPKPKVATPPPTTLLLALTSSSNSTKVNGLAPASHPLPASITTPLHPAKSPAHLLFPQAKPAQDSRSSSSSQHSL